VKAPAGIHHQINNKTQKKRARQAESGAAIDIDM
jgi:hypothetical protein